MKKNAILWMLAVVAVAFSCTTDATHDLGVGLGNDGGLTEVTLSLEESRTQLGEKAGEVYPLLWSEGDQISINGVASTALSASEAGAASATFSVAGSLQKPYCIAYPAAAAGQVLFADKQAHASNTTFGSGVSTMYAYTEDGLGVQLNHLTGVLKIGVVGSAKLVLAQISTVDRKPIAGAFDFDFEKGEAAATSASKEVIEYSFGEGVQLSSEPTYIHAAVPAGVYDELYVTLYDEEGGVMYATVKADTTKPLVAGNVREFSSSIAYAATDKVFVVKDVASLRAFAEQAATLEKDVLFVADVDLTGEAWTPIEGYSKTVRGNGYAIKGLTAPLFGTTNASIKGLHLRDVNINVNGLLHAGALACTITATDTISPVVEHCSASGTISVNNEELTIPEGAAETRVNVGGLVGVAYGVVFESCRNSAKITITKPLADAQAVQFTQSFGGIVGRVHVFTKSDATTITSYVNKSTNSGNLTFGHSTAAEPYLYMGGILGLSGEDNVSGHVSNSINTGKLSANNKIYSLYLAGIVGYARCVTNQADLMPVFENNINRGEIEVKEETVITNIVNVAGIGGRTNSCAHRNSHNYGTINLLKGSVASGTIDIAGVAAYVVYSDTSSGYKIAFNVEDCSNNAPINVGLGRPGTTAGTVRIGGIVAYARARCYRNVNNKEGTITVSGDFYTSAQRATASNEYKNGNYVIGGLYGYKTEGRIYGGANYGDITVSGNWTEKSTKTISQLRVAGIVGYLSTNTEQSDTIVAEGKITISGTFGCEVNVGGLIGLTYASQGTDTCDTDIEVSGTLNGGLVAGGLVALTRLGYTTSTYNGSITVTEDATIGTRCFLSGGIGWLVDYSTSSGYSISGLTNNGNITMAGTANCSLQTGGLIAATTIETNAKAHTCSNLTNLGNITVSGSTKACYISGVGQRSTGNATSLVNGDPNDPTKGVLTFSGNTTGETRLYMSGVMYDFDGNATTCANYAPINISGNTGYTLHCGGLSASFVNPDKTWTECCNYGKITLSGEVGSESITGSDTGADTFVGGLCELVTESTSLRTFVRCVNYGDIEFTETFKSANAMRSAGFYARQENAGAVVLEDCANVGNVTFNGVGSSRSGGNFKLAGGIAGLDKSTVTIIGSFINRGNITVGGGNSRSSVYVGGVFGQYSETCSVVKGGDGDVVVANTGDITFTGSAKSSLRVGGVFATINETAVLDNNIKLVNAGDLTVTGSFGADGTAYVGGIASNFIKVANAESYSEITAYYMKDGEVASYTGVGIIAGGARGESTLVTNCKVGGGIYNYNVEDDTHELQRVTASNFHDFIYGSGKDTDWTGTDNYDGCSHLAKRPTIE